MPLNISNYAISAKNALNSNDVWLTLLEIDYPGEDTIRVVLNNESIQWNSQTWLPYPFKLGPIDDSKDGEVSEVTLTVFDFTRTLTPLIEEYGGGLGAEMTIRVVIADNLQETTPEFEITLEIIAADTDGQGGIQFTLGADNLINYRTPQDRYLKNHCRYDHFKDSYCGYTGSETQCNRTFARCIEIGNETRYGGTPGIGVKGIIA